MYQMKDRSTRPLGGGIAFEIASAADGVTPMTGNIRVELLFSFVKDLG
jgi:hypothetical protein